MTGVFCDRQIFERYAYAQQLLRAAFGRKTGPGPSGGIPPISAHDESCDKFDDPPVPFDGNAGRISRPQTAYCASPLRPGLLLPPQLLPRTRTRLDCSRLRKNDQLSGRCWAP